MPYTILGKIKIFAARMGESFVEQKVANDFSLISLIGKRKFIQCSWLGVQNHRPQKNKIMGKTGNPTLK